MPDAAPEAELFYSPLAEEPDLADLVAQFLREMPERLELLRAAVELPDRRRVRELAHQLAGSSGSHGFLDVGDAARELERAASAGQPQEVLCRALDRLILLSSRMRPGRPAAAHL